jgi:citrate lyase beta subunit
VTDGSSVDPDALADRVDAALAASDARLAAAYPGAAAGREPVHTVYVPADRFHAGTPAEWGAAARAAFDEHAPTAAAVAQIWGLDDGLACAVRERVVRKLTVEPIEDVRVDLEDGYGVRPDDEEDADAVAAVAALGGTAFCGVRFRSLEAPTRRRGLRTLVLVVEALGTTPPPGFVFTLPKVTAVEQVAALAGVLDDLERAYRLGAGALRFEIQVETPQSVLGPDGGSPLPRMIAAAGGRCTGLHYGTYDYSAALGIAAAHQSVEHPAADHAKAVMQVAAAGTGVRLSDGSTNVLPVGDAGAVRAAWALHGRLVRRSLERGFVQGWDLHPAQLPSRYVACIAFYRQGFAQAAARLGAYLDRRDCGFLDEPATVVALAGFLLRGLECGALVDAEVADATGVDRTRLVVLARRVRPS